MDIDWHKDKSNFLEVFPGEDNTTDIFVKSSSVGSWVPREVAAELHEQLGKWLEENPKKPQEKVIALKDVQAGEFFSAFGRSWQRIDHAEDADYYVRVRARNTEGSFLQKLFRHQEVTVTR